jgi:hypothetical protein
MSQDSPTVRLQQISLRIGVQNAMLSWQANAMIMRFCNNTQAALFAELEKMFLV